MFKTINGGKFPTRGSKYSACVDLYTNEDVVIPAGDTVVVGLGICIGEKELLSTIAKDYGSELLNRDTYYKWFKKSHYLQLNPRSSLRAKGLISNTGIIDLDYTKEIKIIIHNPYQNSQHNGNYPIKKGDKIAQITLLEHKSYLFDIQSDDVRDGGFGSTGK